MEFHVTSMANPRQPLAAESPAREIKCKLIQPLTLRTSVKSAYKCIPLRPAHVQEEGPA